MKIENVTKLKMDPFKDMYKKSITSKFVNLLLLYTKIIWIFDLYYYRTELKFIKNDCMTSLSKTEYMTQGARKDFNIFWEHF